jgi:hypothetical protein
MDHTELYLKRHHTYTHTDDKWPPILLYLTQLVYSHFYSNLQRQRFVFPASLELNEPPFVELHCVGVFSFARGLSRVTVGWPDTVKIRVRSSRYRWEDVCWKVVG